MKKEILTHKDAFKAFLAPGKYEVDLGESCVFCQLKRTKGGARADSCIPYCSVHKACSSISYDGDQKKLVRYILRYCKNWRIENIQRLLIKKMKAMGYAV